MMEGFRFRLAGLLLDTEDSEVKRKAAALIKPVYNNVGSGDVVCPSDKKVKVWQHVLGQKELNLQKFEAARENSQEFMDSVQSLTSGSAFQVTKTKLVKDDLFLILNRKALAEAVVGRLSEGGVKLKAHSGSPQIVVKNAEGSRADRSTQLNLLRCCAVANACKNIANQIESDTNAMRVQLIIGCSDAKDLVKGDSNNIGCTVGSVHGLGTSSKDRYISLSTVYRAVYAQYMTQSLERLGPGDQDGLQLAETVHKSTAACIQLQLLSKAPHKSCRLDADEATLQENVFVLYNYSRLVHILDAFKAFPDLPPASEVDFALLKEDEEWQLVFHFLQRYEDVVLSCMPLVGGAAQLHLLPQLLHDLSKVFSRYYNRVRILREPLPSLLPTTFARIHLLRAVKSVYDHTFDLLDIEPVFTM